ncbi:MAG: flagellar hook-basal body complex protein [Candidatus Jidaibacter sp.]|jgi:flagellar basal-body rod protein FlgF|nr:flagellar hook-basal body complex protein [Candidatus Jidaibacter sp.]
MDNISYVLASKQMTSVRNLEVLSNNVANVNTTGFKADSLKFKQYIHKDVLDKTSMTSSPESVTKFTEGAMKSTLRALDVAISGPGFFIVQTPLGNRYTRAGHFNINREGVLVTNEGYSVLSADGQEIVFEEGDADPIIGDNGNVFVGNATRGQIGVVEFDDLKSMKKLGNGLFTSKANINEATDSRVLQGMLEESNVNAISEIALLAQIQKEVSETTNFINETYVMQRNSFKAYAKLGG